MKQTMDTAQEPKPASSARGAERRSAILSVAIDHIARLGFEGLRVRDVAQEVGINNATLHHHYPTKEALIAGVVERFTATFAAAQSAAVAGDVDQRLESYAANVRALMEAKPAMFMVLNELLVRANRDAEIAKLIAPSQERWRAYLLHLLAGAPMSQSQKEEAAERCRNELLGESLSRSARGLLKPSH